MLKKTPKQAELCLKKNMLKKITIALSAILIVYTGNGQVGSLIKNKIKETAQTGTIANPAQKMRVVTLEEVEANIYAEEDRFVKTENADIIFKGTYKQPFEDRIGFSGFYYLNSYAMLLPSSHFSSDTAKAFSGFSMEYMPDAHTMNIHWSKDQVNNGVILEQYTKSADKGNIMFQLGMLGGPQEYFNVECLLLEPGVILIGAYVYHKNDEVGHQWMNDIEPKGFVIAAKDTAKFKEYESRPEYTSKVVFEKFDALRRVWLEGEIEDAKPLPAQGMTNPTLKKEALQLITQTAKAYQWKESIEYAYITSNEWDVEVSVVSGKPIKRSLKCIVVMKTPNGNFKREGFYIGQKYTGSGYGSTYMLYNDQRIYYVNPKEAYKYK